MKQKLLLKIKYNIYSWIFRSGQTLKLYQEENICRVYFSMKIFICIDIVSITFVTTATFIFFQNIIILASQFCFASESTPSQSFSIGW